MTKQLLSIIFGGVMLASLLAGCTSSQPKEMPTGHIPVGGFVQTWEAPLKIGSKNTVTHLYLLQNALYVYTSQNLVYCISPSGGQILWIQQVGAPGDLLTPPVQIKGATVIALNSTIWVLGPDGKVIRTINVGHSIRSPLAAMGDVVYGGVDYKNGGRLAKIDLTLPYNNTRWELMTGRGISATPVIYEDAIYAGGEDGNVYAVNEDRAGIWPLDGSLFATNGPIMAGLKVDDFGLYVASMDSKLYCLDRETGKLKWRFYSGHPLDKSPQVTADSVYQAIPEVGVAAIDKTTGDPVRTARWIVKGAQRFIGEDSQYAYLRGGDNSILGVDKTTGQIKLHSTRKDLSAFTTNPKGNLLFVGTANGLILGVTPVTAPGTVGQVVRSSDLFEMIASAR